MHTLGAGLCSRLRGPAAHLHLARVHRQGVARLALLQLLACRQHGRALGQQRAGSWSMGRVGEGGWGVARLALLQLLACSRGRAGKRPWAQPHTHFFRLLVRTHAVAMRCSAGCRPDTRQARASRPAGGRAHPAGEKTAARPAGRAAAHWCSRRRRAPQAACQPASQPRRQRRRASHPAHAAPPSPMQ